MSPSASEKAHAIMMGEASPSAPSQPSTIRLSQSAASMSRENPAGRCRDSNAIPSSISERGHDIMMGQAGPSAPRRFAHINRPPRMAVDTHMFGGGEFLSDYEASTNSVSPGNDRRDACSEDVKLVETMSDEEVHVKVPDGCVVQKGSSKGPEQKQGRRQGLFRSTELGPGDDCEMHERLCETVEQQREPSGRTKRHIWRLSATMSDFGRRVKRRISFWDRRDSGYRSDDEEGGTNSKGRYSAASPLLDIAPPRPSYGRDDGGPIEPSHTLATARPSNAGVDVRRSTQTRVVANAGPHVVPGTETPENLRPMISAETGLSCAQLGEGISRTLTLAHQHGVFDRKHLDRKLSAADGNATTPEQQSKASQTLKLELEKKRTKREQEAKEVAAAGSRKVSLSQRFSYDASTSNLERLARKERTRSLLFFKIRSGTGGS
ncbi:hypothetical protein LTR85_008417 [Meristemomyces frigidus]|nr:hypothetical protein LTR85_008417 [Meristemomyces frigidus]